MPSPTISDQFLAILNGMIIKDYLGHYRSHRGPLEWILRRYLLVEDIYMSESVPCPTLRVLIERSTPDLSRLIFGRRCRISCEFFCYLGNFPSLKVFGVLSCGDISQELMIRFLTLNPQLETFLLGRAEGYCSDFIISLAARCPRMFHLELPENDWVDDECISITELAQPDWNSSLSRIFLSILYYKYILISPIFHLQVLICPSRY